MATEVSHVETEMDDPVDVDVETGMVEHVDEHVVDDSLDDDEV